MLDDPRISEAERTGACPYGTWTGLGGVYAPIKNPLPSGNSEKGKKHLYILNIPHDKGVVNE